MQKDSYRSVIGNVLPGKVGDFTIRTRVAVIAGFPAMDCNAANAGTLALGSEAREHHLDRFAQVATSMTVPDADPPSADERVPVVVARLVGIYDADGGLAGEAKYVVGHLLGRLECALCDITHGPVRRKQTFDAFRARLGVPFDVVHRNERSPEIVRATGDGLPCVVAVTDAKIVALLDRAALEACGGEVAQLEVALVTATVDRNLLLPLR